MKQPKIASLIAVFSFVALTLGEPLYAAFPVSTSTGAIIASKRTRNVEIVLTSDSGKLTGGDNSFCVLFQSVETRDSADVRNVSVDFRQLVGKLQEEPIRATLTQDGVGHYCGEINLGRQYYTPSSYYAFVRYTDATGKQRRARLYVSVK